MKDERFTYFDPPISGADGSLAAAPVADPGARPEVAVFGEWDTTNLGDRAIHHEVQRFFAECGWDVSSYGLGSLTPSTPDTADKRAPAASWARGAARRLNAHAKRALRQIRQRYRMLRLLPQLERAKAISVGGGALLTDVNLHFPQSLAVLADAARLLDKPLLCLGCSADGPWSAKGERQIRKFLSACDIVAARDEVTAGRISAVLRRQIPIFGDFCLTEAHVWNDGLRAPPRCDLAINVCRNPGSWNAMQDRYEDALVALTNHVRRGAVGSARRAIQIFTTDTADDVVAARRVFARLDGDDVELHVPKSVDELAAVMRDSAIVVASRLHSAILALAQNTPVVGLSPMPKLRDFFSTIGLAQYSFDLAGHGELAHWLTGAEHEAIYAEQRRALVGAPMWLARAQVRKMLESARGMPRAVGPEVKCT
jgi:polysaccharide pyruvyl transferase WcaK-like protein